MRNKIFGRQFKRDTNERKALFKSLMSALILMDRIKTTHEKAKAIQGSVEKLVTKAKKKGESSKREMGQYLTEPAIEKLIADIVPRFSKRPGGYTRIIKMQKRLSDKAHMSIIEWVEGPGVKIVKVQEVSRASSEEKTEEPKQKTAEKKKSKVAKAPKKAVKKEK